MYIKFSINVITPNYPNPLPMRQWIGRMENELSFSRVSIIVQDACSKTYQAMGVAMISWEYYDIM
jgi:hypothetical protein